MTPGADPYRSLAAALTRVAVDPPAPLVDRLLDGPRGIQRGVQRILPDGDGTVLVVIDQFEELFTLCDDEDARARFLESFDARGVGSLVSAAGRPHPSGRLPRSTVAPPGLRRGPQASDGDRDATGGRRARGGDRRPRRAGRGRAGAGARQRDRRGRGVAAGSATAAAVRTHRAVRRTHRRCDDDSRRTGRWAGWPEHWRRPPTTCGWPASPDEQAAARRLFGRLVTLGDGVEDTRRLVTLVAELGTEDRR